MNNALRGLFVVPLLSTLALAGGAGAPPPRATSPTVASPAAAAPAALVTAPTDFLTEEQVWEIELPTGRVMRFQLTEEIANEHSSVFSVYSWVAGLADGAPYGALLLSGQRTLLAWAQADDSSRSRVCFARIGTAGVHRGVMFDGSVEDFERLSDTWQGPTATNDAQMWQQYARDLNIPCTLRRLL